MYSIRINGGSIDSRINHQVSILYRLGGFGSLHSWLFSSVEIPMSSDDIPYIDIPTLYYPYLSDSWLWSSGRRGIGSLGNIAFRIKNGKLGLIPFTALKLGDSITINKVYLVLNL